MGATPFGKLLNPRHGMKVATKKRVNFWPAVRSSHPLDFNHADYHAQRLPGGVL